MNNEKYLRETRFVRSWKAGERHGPFGICTPENNTPPFKTPYINWGNTSEIFFEFFTDIGHYDLMCSVGSFSVSYWESDSEESSEETNVYTKIAQHTLYRDKRSRIHWSYLRNSFTTTIRPKRSGGYFAIAIERLKSADYFCKTISNFRVYHFPGKTDVKSKISGTMIEKRITLYNLIS